jgi:excisionase family DNA binding protein
MSEPTPLLEQQYTLREAAEIMKYDERTIYRLIERGELAAIGRGRLRRIALKDIRAYQSRNRTNGEVN